MPDGFDGRNNAFDGPFRNKNLNKVKTDVLRMAEERRLGTSDQQTDTGGDAGLERMQNVSARMDLSSPFDRMPMPRQNKTGVIAFDDNSFQVNGDAKYKYRWVGNSLQAMDVTKGAGAWRNVDTSKVAQTWEGWKMAEAAPRNAAQLVDRAATGFTGPVDPASVAGPTAPVFGPGGYSSLSSPQPFADPNSVAMGPVYNRYLAPGQRGR